MKNKQEYFSAFMLGSEYAYKQIMQYWYAPLLNFANGYLRNMENSKEVVQDVFLQLWEQRTKLKSDTSLNAYLFTLVRNKCIDTIRREKLMLQFREDKKEEYFALSESFEALSHPILDNIFAFELQSRIDEVIDSLPDQCRKVFELSRKKGLKNREISSLLNISDKTVESHITKALRTIRKMLEEKFPSSYTFLFCILKKSKFLVD